MFGRRVLLADPDPEFRKKLKDLLQQQGYLVVAETEDGRSTLQAAFQNQPDIIIMEGMAKPHPRPRRITPLITPISIPWEPPSGPMVMKQIPIKPFSRLSTWTPTWAPIKTSS